MNPRLIPPRAAAAVPPDEMVTAVSVPVEGPRDRRLGKFQLLEKVGEGAFGAVWRALDVQLNRTVALKIPQAHLIENHEDVERFYTEARVVAQLRHPGIVTLHEVMVIDDLPILVHDFVTGISLRDLCATRRLTPRAAAGLIAKVADALAYAHSMGAIHRDVKPANIMLDPSTAGAERRPRASRAPAGRASPGSSISGWRSSSRTTPSSPAGTGSSARPAYMSPEQAIGATRATIRSIIAPTSTAWASCSSSSSPGPSPSPARAARSSTTSSMASRTALDRAIHRVSPDLDSICLKAMAREPRLRYASARELADDLRNFLQGEPVRARPISRWQRFLRRAQRRPAETALGLMGLVTVLAVIGLGAGHRYQRRLEREFRATEMARQAEAAQKERAESFLYFHRMALAEREWSANNIDRVERLLEDCPPRLRGWEWRYLKRQCHHDLLSLYHSQPSPAVVDGHLHPLRRRMAAPSRRRARTGPSASGTRRADGS